MSAPAFLDVGLHDNVPAAVYHADPCTSPSLSSSCARTLLSRSIAHAALEHPRIGGHGREATNVMRFGSAVHAIQSGDESEIVVGRDFDSYRTNAAKAWRDGVLSSGRVPVLLHEMDDIRPCAQSLIDNIGKGITNDPFAPFGRSEVTLIWKEGEIYCRARIDRLVIDPAGGAYADMWDWKTTTDVSPDAIQKKIASDGIHIQEAFYRRGLSKLLTAYAGRISFNLGFVESRKPYATRRACISTAYQQIGDAEVSRAIRAWQHASATNDFTDASAAETLHVSPPNWLQIQHEERNAA